MLITNIGLLVGTESTGHEKLFLRGKDMNVIGLLPNAWLRVDDANGRFHSWGSMDDRIGDPDSCPHTNPGEAIVDAHGGYVFPSFCDSHTHLVYAGSREKEFIDKINGLSYEEIAKRGGGILNSADLLHATSENELYEQAMTRVNEIIAMGTGCVEIKSGYGLTVADELKMLRVIARIASSTPMKVKLTFLGAHAVGRAFVGRQGDYVDHVCKEMLPAIASEGLAEFVDVFCDEGLRPKIHANELAVSGGVQVGVAHKALSVDHLERIGEDEIAILAESQTVATMLPGASFFLGMPYAPARKAIADGAIVALASDYNPGSSPSGNMRMVMSLGCIKMKLTPAQAINATTINGAYAMGESRDYGSIAPGKVANFYITKPMPSLDFYPYAYTTPLISRVYLQGKEIVG